MRCFILKSLFHSLSDLNSTMIVIGESGSGKSSCCNIFVGESHDSEVFPASLYSTETTQKTKIYPAHYLGNLDRPFTIIDTQGFNDPNSIGNSKKECNQTIVMELMKSLTRVSHINLFLVCVNGTTLRRLNESLQYMLRVFEDIFGHKIVDGEVQKDPDTFWSKCMFLVTNLGMDKKSIKKRVGCYDPDAYKQIIHKQLSEFTKELGIDVPNHVIIDALYDADDEAEVTEFNNATNLVYDALLKTSPAMTEAMLRQSEMSMKGKVYLSCCKKSYRNYNFKPV